MSSRIIFLLLFFIYFFSLNAEDIKYKDTTAHNLFSFYIDDDFKRFETIIKETEDINIYDKHGNNILFYTIKNNDLKYTKKILQKGINVNHTNYYLQTPLLVAVEIGNEDIIQLLLDYRAKIDVYDLYGNSPIDYTKYNNLYGSYLIIRHYQEKRRQRKDMDGLEEFIKNFDLEPIDEM